MNVFCRLCTTVPHFNQLSNYAVNKDLAIKKVRN